MINKKKERKIKGMNRKKNSWEDRILQPYGKKYEHSSKN
jgi:hypothetical protein